MTIRQYRTDETASVVPADIQSMALMRCAQPCSFRPRAHGARISWRTELSDLRDAAIGTRYAARFSASQRRRTAELSHASGSFASLLHDFP